MINYYLISLRYYKLLHFAKAFIIHIVLYNVRFKFEYELCAVVDVLEHFMIVQHTTIKLLKSKYFDFINFNLSLEIILTPQSKCLNKCQLSARWNCI